MSWPKCLLALILISLLFCSGLAQGQNFDSLCYFRVDSEILDLQIDEDKGLVYLAYPDGTQVYNLEERELSNLKIRKRELPNYLFNKAAFPSNAKLVSQANSFRKALFSNNGDYLIYYNLEQQYEYVYVYKRRRSRYKLHQIINNQAAVNSAAINNDGVLALGSAYGQIRLWNIKGKNFIRLMNPNISTGAVFKIQFSEQNENTIIISNGASECVLINIETDEVKGIWKYGFIQVPDSPSRLGQGVTEMYLTNNDSLALIGLHNKLHKSLNIWHIDSNQLQSISTEIIQPIAFDFYQSTIYLADSSGHISEFDLKSHEINCSYSSGQEEIQILKISNTGKYLLCADRLGVVMIYRSFKSGFND